MSTSSLPPIVTVTLNPALDVSTSVDRVVSRHKLRCDAPRVEAGGGGVNVARTIVALGGAATPVYTVGGLTGERYRLLLHQEGLPGVPIPIGGETRESISVGDRSQGDQYRFVFPGPTVTAEECRRCLDAAVELLRPGGYLVASGSLPPGAPESFYADAVRLAKQRGARCAIDAYGSALTLALAAGPDLVKQSVRELGELTGRELSTIELQDAALHELLDGSSVGAIALSLGAAGAALAIRGEAQVLRAPAFPVAERSTVGAGDAFLGAFVLRTVQGRSTGEALRAALAAGSAVAASVGTTAPHRELVERLEREG
ncbi:1-phosphofructokinase family hexose kinase [Lysinimonas soli]|uniref:1-phosphofructokinase family hexose kinase n=1 Tax=Lysinimonas soli TaxID=1074233 RepID=A0ABW0NQF2_9MICO